MVAISNVNLRGEYVTDRWGRPETQDKYENPSSQFLETQSYYFELMIRPGAGARLEGEYNSRWKTVTNKLK